MRLLALGLLIAATSSTACSGPTKGTGGDGGTSSLGGPTSGFDDSPDVTTEDGGGSTLPPKGGGGTTSEYDVLFAELPGTRTPDAIYGVWSGIMGVSEDDVRVKLESSSMTVAVRCGSGNGSHFQTTIGLKVSATVTSDEIQILESKSVAIPACKITVTPQTFTSGSISGFTLAGTSLDFPSARLWKDTQRSVGPEPMLTKVSD